MNKIILFMVLSAFLIGLTISQTKVKLPPTTIVVVKTDQELEGGKLKPMQEIIFSVAADVKVGGYLLIKAGTPAIGVVQAAEGAGMVGQGGQLSIAIQTTSAVDGTTVALSGSFFAKGESSTGEKVAVGVILCPLALLCKGDKGEIPAGAQVRTLTIGEYEISVKE